MVARSLTSRLLFAFVVPANGQLSVNIATADPSMVLRLTTFAPDRSNIGFGPDVEKGKPLHHVFPVVGNQTYYVQVWTAGGTSGAYTMTLTLAESK